MPIRTIRRTLFSREELGVTQFERLRENAINFCGKSEDIVEYKMKLLKDFENLALDKKRNNLKEYIFLIDGKADELATLKSYLADYYKTYNSSVHNVKEFVYGTQIMRLLYILNLPDEAVKVNE